jgi:hypothetical protein
VADLHIWASSSIDRVGGNINQRGNFRYPPIFHRFTTIPLDTKKLSLTPLIFQILSLMTFLVVICPNYPSLQNYAVLGSPKTTLFCPNFFFFFFFKKKKEIKKRGGGGEKSGWLEPPLAQKMGWPNHPIFGQGVVDHPISAVWGWLKPPPGL